MKRSDYISWDTYFMGVALMSAMRSKDPNTQVGACIVNEKMHIIGIGYNGFPVGCDDEDFPWDNNGQFLESKYPYVVHAEPNAILNASQSLDNATMYVTLFPCNECAKLIIQSGIKEIVYLSEKYEGTDGDIASKKMLAAAHVKTRKMIPFTIHIKEDSI
ncbi:MAG: dCMP deaminase family protein [Bacilli bacterium]